MPELPDIVVYLDALAPRVLRQRLARLRVIRNPFVLRSRDPPIAERRSEGSRGLRRMGKRIVLRARGRAVPRDPPDDRRAASLAAAEAKPPGRLGARGVLISETGQLVLTEAGTQAPRVAAPGAGRRGLAAVRARRARGVRVRLAASPPGYGASGTPSSARSPTRGSSAASATPTRMRSCTGPGSLHSRSPIGWLKRPLRLLTRPWRCSGVDRAAPGGVGRRISREGHRVPGRDGGTRPVPAPCPVCGAPVQRIRYADNETNYCARCQTAGRLLADRALSRLLREDWPRSINEID